MAIHTVRVPWTPGYDIGVGADLASGSAMNSPVVADATPVDQASGASIDLQIQRIQSTEQLERALGVDVEASYGCAAFGPSMSARFNFAKQSKVQTSSLFMTISVRVDLEFLSIDAPRLTESASAVVDNPELFESRYGNMFVRGLGRGGLFVGVLKIDTRSSEESKKISSELEGSYGLFSAEAQMNLSEVMKSYDNEMFVRQYQEGGPRNLVVDDPTQPLTLLENANKFIRSYDVDQAEVSNVAVPFFVTLAPTTIAEGPIPPNPADVQKAQDVLIYCARKRSAALDNLNLLQHVADNPSMFPPEVVAPGTVQEAIRQHQDDLMLIADCASAAIADRSSALYPEQFAADRGRTFPVSTMPTLPASLPAAAAPETKVTVPDFGRCTSQRECRALAESHQLVTALELEGALEPTFRVIRTDPAAGTEVPPGSTVKIVAPPVGTQPTSTPPTVRGRVRDHRAG